MATSTPYLNLVKPSYSETADIGVLNENADIIDQAVSAQAQAIAGKPDNATEMPLGSNDTTPVSQAFANLQNEIGIVCTGNTCAISASTGQYVVLKNSTISGRADGLYTAAKTIPANTEIDSTYLTQVSNGGLNNLKGQVDALNSKFTLVDNTGDSGGESYIVAVQSDGRVQHYVNTGTINRMLQYSESGIISEIKGGTTLWTTANMFKVKALSTQISANGNSAYTNEFSFTPDTGYTAVATVGYNILWNHLEVYGFKIENNKVFLAIQNTSSSAMTNVSATFYVLQIKSAYV